jgi:ketosteroid isomerase-like protein
MDAEAKKELCKEFQRAMERGDRDFIDSILAPDYTFENIEDEPVHNPNTGETYGPKFTRQQYLDIGVPSIKKFTVDGMHFEFEYAVCDGPIVALFGSSNGQGLNGKKYANRYCWLYRFDDNDKIDLKREYKDTYLSRKTLYED